MRVTVFGATGAIGRLAVTDLIAAGHAVTAYVRNPTKVPASWGDRVDVVVGEITDPVGVERAVVGSDAVVSTLGPDMSRRAEGLPLVDGVRHIVAAMKKGGIRRIVANGTPAWRHPHDGRSPSTVLAVTMARLFLPRAYREMIGMSTAVAESDLDWTIVRFLAPQDGPAKGRLRIGLPGRNRVGLAVTRADIAAFTVTQLTDPTHIGGAPLISN